MFDQGSPEMEISGKNRYIKCLTQDKTAYALGKIHDDVTMKKTKYTIKIACEDVANVVVGITTQANWINSKVQQQESFFFIGATGNFIACGKEICTTKAAKKDSSIEFLHDIEKGDLRLKIDKREPVVLILGNPIL